MNGLINITLMVILLSLGAVNSYLWRENYYEGCDYDNLFYEKMFSKVIEHRRPSTPCVYSTIKLEPLKRVRLLFSEVELTCQGVQNEIAVDVAEDYAITYCENIVEHDEFVVQVDNPGEEAKRINLIRKGKIKFRVVAMFEPLVEQNNTLRAISHTNCGQQAISPDSSNFLQRIVGGDEAVANSWPWQVILITCSRSSCYVCGGTLIDNRWVLTAAHCAPSRYESTVAYLGVHSFTFKGTERKVYGMWFRHPSWNTKTLANDIALFRLNTEITYNDYISPVCLPNGRSTSVGSSGVATGWGLTKPDGSGPLSSVLRQVSIPVGQSFCETYGRRYFENFRQICAGDLVNEKDTCQGDSGGPFQQKDSITGQWYIAGVTSYGVGCSGGGVYTRVSTYESWIRTTMDRN